MAIIESFASFRDRAIQFGIDEADVSILKDKKFASFGAFTFIAIYNPNSADDATLKAALAHVLGRDITIEDMARFRRLHFESNAITISDAKRRTEATSEDTPKRVPAPERAARHNEQVRRHSGIMMTTAVEPSHALLDRVQQQLEENQAAYVTPELCTSRLQEINGVKKDKDAANTTIVEVGRFLKVSDEEPDQRTAVSDSYVCDKPFGDEPWPTTRQASPPLQLSSCGPSDFVLPLTKNHRQITTTSPSFKLLRQTRRCGYALSRSAEPVSFLNRRQLQKEQP